MNRPNIKYSGVLYSAYSERGVAIKRWKRANKREQTVIPRSILITAAIAPLAVQCFT